LHHIFATAMRRYVNYPDNSIGIGVALPSSVALPLGRVRRAMVHETIVSSADVTYPIATWREEM
jgi:hypothetical protein